MLVLFVFSLSLCASLSYLTIAFKSLKPDLAFVHARQQLRAVKIKDYNAFEDEITRGIYENLRSTAPPTSYKDTEELQAMQFSG